MSWNDPYKASNWWFPLFGNPWVHLFIPYLPHQQSFLVGDPASPASPKADGHDTGVQRGGSSGSSGSSGGSSFWSWYSLWWWNPIARWIGAPFLSQLLLGKGSPLKVNQLEKDADSFCPGCTGHASLSIGKPKGQRKVAAILGVPKFKSPNGRPKARSSATLVEPQVHGFWTLRKCGPAHFLWHPRTSRLSPTCPTERFPKPL